MKRKDKRLNRLGKVSLDLDKPSPGEK